MASSLSYLVHRKVIILIMMLIAIISYQDRSFSMTTT